MNFQTIKVVLKTTRHTRAIRYSADSCWRLWGKSKHGGPHIVSLLHLLLWYEADYKSSM